MNFNAKPVPLSRPGLDYLAKNGQLLWNTL